MIGNHSHEIINKCEEEIKPLITEQLSSPLPPYCLQNMGWVKARQVERPTPPDIPFNGFTTARNQKLAHLCFVYILDRELLPPVLLPKIVLLMSGMVKAELKTASSPRFGAR